MTNRYEGGALTADQFLVLVNSEENKALRELNASREAAYNDEYAYYINKYMWSIQKTNGASCASVIVGGDPSTDEGLTAMKENMRLLGNEGHDDEGRPITTFVMRVGDYIE